MQRSLDDYYNDEIEASKRTREKWSTQRKKEARSMAERIGCSATQADALNQRAKRGIRSGGLERIQGSYLEFSERVEKLNTNLHTETMNKEHMYK